MGCGNAEKTGGGGSAGAGSGSSDFAGSGGAAGGGSTDLEDFDNGTSNFLDAGNPDAAPISEEVNLGECGATSFAAKQIVVEKEVEVEKQVTKAEPVSLYIMFDKSLSMAQSKIWDPAVDATKAFLQSDESAGVSVGMQFFPISGGKCASGAGYSTPAVAVGELPGQLSKLEGALDTQNPDGYGTPIEGALRGVTNFCKTYQSSHSDQQCVAVLITDGKPEHASGCSEDQDFLAGIAKAAKDAGVTTFAVGLKGADFTLLDKIAKQGGAPDCDPNNAQRYACDVSAGADKLGDALNQIRDTVVTIETHIEIVKHTEQTALPCEWEIPAQQNGLVFDRDKVNIRFSTASDDKTFVRVASSDSCIVNGWRFDNPAAPTRMLACPQTCDMITNTPDAKIDILLGCETQRAPE